MAGAFVRHRGLIAFAAGGAMAEALLLSFVAPSARPLAPQVTALPPLAAYHDLRWLFAFNQPWPGFTGALVLLVVARSAVDAVLVMLAWPRETEPGIPRPRFLPSLLSCAVLTVLVGLVMSPVVTLMFGVALLPFSWPYLAAVPILLGTAVALSQGGVGQAWWRRLPPARTAAWVIATFGVLSLASALMTHLDTPGIVAVAGLAGIVDARAWYGLTAAAARGVAEGPPHPWQWRAALWRIRRVLRSRTNWLPVAPLAAVMVLALVVGLARHPHVPIGSVVLLSPIIEPGQVDQAGQGAGTVPGAALTTLNDLVGDMSPYGRSGARALIESVSEVGASYFATVSRGTGRPWLAVIPLADAVTLPACSWPENVIFIDAFHGGLLGARSVQRIVEAFLASGRVPDSDLAGLAGGSQQDLRSAAQLIAAAASAWRMPDLHSACPSP